MITHYDLFAGIGGFSLALEEVFNDDSIRHIFCEWEAFPTSVLKQHWPNGEYWGDIKDLVTHTKHERLEGSSDQRQRHTGLSSREGSDQTQDWTILTGGFPCQPFSAAGRRRGTADDRYQWPNMFEVIRNVKPEWVIAENVRGLVTWNEGMVLEQVCADLESEGYEVQPFIIPAVSVNAPHRRDRVWVIAHRDSQRGSAGHREVQETDGEIPERHDHAELSDTDRHTTSNTEHPRLDATQNREGVNQRNDSDATRQNEPIESARPSSIRPENANTRNYPDWNRNWQEVAFATCDDSVDDGLSRLVDGVPYSRAKWRKDSLKAYGNGIVPEVAMNIMQAIKVSVDRQEA